MIERLIHLVQRKNDLNRRRRRFHYHWAMDTYLPEAEALAGYNKAKQDMKAMTPILKEMRKEINAKFVWNAGGMMTHVVYEGARIHHGQFKSISNSYLAERYLLGIEE